MDKNIKIMNVWNGTYGNYERPVIYVKDNAQNYYNYFERGNLESENLVEMLANSQSKGYQIIFAEPKES